MIFNAHSDLSGLHAFLSASKHAWLNYDEEKIDRMYLTTRAAQRGTELHAFAHEAIRLGIRQATRPVTTLGLYVNDAIGYRMKPEQVLYYSPNAFGTADAIAFRKNLLRIHDLKTGSRTVTEKQLEIYAALFCLEYRVNPLDIQIELRIYQNNEAVIYDGDPMVIVNIMDKFKWANRRLEALRMEELS